MFKPQNQSYSVSKFITNFRTKGLKLRMKARVKGGFVTNS